MGSTSDGIVPGSGVARHVEAEWQFDALDLRPVERWLAALPARSATRGGDPASADTVHPRASPAPAGTPSSDAGRTREAFTLTALAKPTRRLVDRYIDTEDWRIARAGYVLRTRHRGRHDEATLKSLEPATSGGLRRRLELTELLPDGDVGQLSVDGPVGGRVGAMTGPRLLRTVLEVRTRRRPFSLRVSGQEIAELSLDDTTIVGGDQRPVRLRRAEVEVNPAWLEVLQPIVEDLVAACGLRPASLSKFEAGLLGLGLSLPGPPELGSTDVTPSSTMSAVALAVLRRNLGQLIAHEQGTRLGEDPEHLHDMRVATRRLRAALDIFEEVLPARAQIARSELGWLGRVLGEVRDLDVQLERHDADAVQIALLLGDGLGGEPLDPLRQRLVEERRAARAHLLQALDSTRYRRLLDSLVSLVRSGSTRRGPLPRAAAVATMPEMVAKRHRATWRAARRARHTGEAADYHRLRIQCKRLRYCLEFAAGVYGGRTDRFVRRLTKLQDSLGRFQDDQAAAARLYQMAIASRPPLPAETVYVMGAVATHYRRDALCLLPRLRKRLGTLRGNDWNELVKIMERRRFDAVARAPLGGPPAHHATPEATAAAAGSARPARSPGVQPARLVPASPKPSPATPPPSPATPRGHSPALPPVPSPDPEPGARETPRADPGQVPG